MDIDLPSRTNHSRLRKNPTDSDKELDLEAVAISNNEDGLSPADNSDNENEDLAGLDNIALKKQIAFEVI